MIAASWHSAWTDAVVFAYRVAMDRQLLNFRKVFSMMWLRPCVEFEPTPGHEFEACEGTRVEKRLPQLLQKGDIAGGPDHAGPVAMGASGLPPHSAHEPS